MSREVAKVLLAGIMGIGASSPALAQPGYPSGSIPTVSPAVREAMVRAFEQDKPDIALRQYFGTVYDSLRPAWVVYLDGVKARQWLVQKNDTVASRVLIGEKNLFVRVFARGTTDTVKAATTLFVDSVRQGNSSTGGIREGVRTIINVDTIVIAERIRSTQQQLFRQPAVPAVIYLTRSALDYKADPALIRLVAAAGNLLKIYPGEDTTDDPPRNSTVDTLRLVNVSTDTQFYAAWARIPLSENTQYLIALGPGPGRSFGTDQVVITNIGNAGRSRFGAAIAGGMTFRGDVRRSVDDSVAPQHSERLNLYVFGHWFLRSPQLPWRKSSRSLVLGTNVLEGNLFDDVVLGHSWGRYTGAVGYVLGINLLEGVNRDGSETRFVRPFFGLDYLF